MEKAEREYFSNMRQYYLRQQEKLMSFSQLAKESITHHFDHFFQRQKQLVEKHQVIQQELV